MAGQVRSVCNTPSHISLGIAVAAQNRYPATISQDQVQYQCISARSYPGGS